MFPLLLVVAAASAAPQETDPLESGVAEEVEVRLVIVDVLVLDKKRRTVPDLSVEDFELFVDYKPVPIDTLDVRCPSGSVADPRPVRRRGNVREAVAPETERRIALVVDYMHLGQISRVDVLERMREMIRDSQTPNEEIMVVALTGGRPRVEQGFTRDRQAVLDTLARMEHDITLWQPAFDHEHEHRFFRDLKTLIDLLGLVEGSKAIVLFSNLPGPSASYDTEFEAVASKATESRVVLYPVLARGLSRSSAPRLARLAVETGGRFTENTNDLSLGYARAQRDLACRYAIGFYDRTTGRGEARRVSVRVRPPKLRTLHAYNYTFPSEKQRRRARLWSGFIAPEMFSGSLVQAQVFPLRPAGRRRWEALVAISFAVEPDLWDGDAATRDFGAVIRRGHTIVRRFTHRVDVGRTDGLDRAARPVTLLKTVRLKHGRYTLTAVVSDPAAELPEATSLEIELPEVPRETLFFVDPILARRPEDSLVVRREPLDAEEPLDFEPLLVPSVDRSDRPEVLTRLCRAGPVELDPAAGIRRSLSREDGTLVAVLPFVRLELPSDESLPCQELRDALPTEGLEPGRYVFRAEVDHGGDALLRFAVEE